MFLELRTEAAVEADADGDILRVHRADERIESFRRMVQTNPRVDVDVDHGKFRFKQVVLRHAEHRFRSEFLQGEVATFATVELRIGSIRRRLVGVRERTPRETRSKEQRSHCGGDHFHGHVSIEKNQTRPGMRGTIATIGRTSSRSARL